MLGNRAENMSILFSFCRRKGTWILLLMKLRTCLSYLFCSWWFNISILCNSNRKLFFTNLVCLFEYDNTSKFNVNPITTSSENQVGTETFRHLSSVFMISFQHVYINSYSLASQTVHYDHKTDWILNISWCLESYCPTYLNPDSSSTTLKHCNLLNLSLGSELYLL